MKYVSEAMFSGFRTKIAVATNIYSTQTAGLVSIILFKQSEPQKQTIFT